MSVTRFAGRSTAAVAIAALAVAAGGIGYAAASSGGVFILGEHNAAATVTSLSNSKGTALSLSAKKGKPPLTVNSTVKVPHLNSSLLDGASASGLATSGSSVTTNYPEGRVGTVETTPTILVETGKLRAGTYFVTGSAYLFVPTDDTGRCQVAPAGAAGSVGPLGQAATSNQDSTISETAPVKVSAGGRIAEFCWMDGTGGAGQQFSSGLSAIRVASASKGTVEASHPEV